MSTFHLEIIVLDRAFYSDEVQELVVKTPDGEIGILRGHIPVVEVVSTGLAKIKKDDKWIYAAVSDGFMEITGDQAVILADSAEWPEEIDRERAKAAEERARRRLDDQPGGMEDVASRAALQRALSRQKASEKRNS